MSRKESTSPLAGAAPSLSPTARPLAIQIGARPAPNRGSLMELAESFREVNPELRAMLRDAAAREERDALALGELEAQKTGAAKRIGEIEATIKQAVDEGRVSHVRLPAFERGFRLRVGKDLAQSVFQEKLLGQLSDTTRVEGRKDPEQVIADTYAEVTKGIHPEDFFARAAFDDTAQGVIAGFRQRSAEGYTAAFKRDAETRIADEGSELVFQLASAAEDDAPALRQSVRVHLDTIRNELPRSEVNKFYVSDVITPAVRKLVEAGKSEEARNLLLELGQLDVTGTGGMLSQTSVAKTAFADLGNYIESRALASQREAEERMDRQYRTLQMEGKLAAAARLSKLRQDGGGTLDPSTRFEIIEAYRKENPDDPLRVEAYAATVHREFDGEEKWRVNDRAVAELESSLNSYSKERVELGRVQIRALWETGEISSAKFTQLSQRLDQLDGLYGAIGEDDINRFKRDLYAARDEVRGTTINFGDSSAAPGADSYTLWEALPEAARAEHETLVTQLFNDTLQSEIRAIGDINKVPAEKAQAIDRATLKARDYARTLLRDLNRRRIEEETKAKVEKQAQRVRNASILNLGIRPALGTGYKIPGKSANAAGLGGPMLSEGYPNPGPEADAVEVRIPFHSFSEWFLPGAAGSTRRVVLSELAKDIRENADEVAANKSRDLYTYVKSRLGFTPEEVQNGATADGVAFLPSAIDPQTHTVFRSKAELEKHWNNGNPSDLFLAVGDAVDPDDKITSEDFYLAQAALITGRKLFGRSKKTEAAQDGPTTASDSIETKETKS